MKKISLALICLTYMFGCKDNISKETSQSNTTKTDIKKASAKIENFNCSTFLEKGDYSSICFIDSKTPNYIGGGCVFDFEIKGNKHNQSIKVQFTEKGSASLAEMSYNLFKNNYKKGTVTDVSNTGDAAFFDVHGTDLKSTSSSNKDLHVQYKNITFIIMAEYKSNTEMPCFYTNKDLALFAEEIIKNL